jgi:hypothetical protein
MRLGESGAGMHCSWRSIVTKRGPASSACFCTASGGAGPIKTSGPTFAKRSGRTFTAGNVRSRGQSDPASKRPPPRLRHAEISSRWFPIAEARARDRNHGARDRDGPPSDTALSRRATALQRAVRPRTTLGEQRGCAHISAACYEVKHAEVELLFDAGELRAARRCIGNPAREPKDRR